MNSNRKAAIIVGVLYIVATVAGVISLAPLASLLDGPDILTNIAENENKLIMVSFLNLIMAVAVAGVAFMIYPILKQDTDTEVKEGLALWYVGTRITEGATFVVGVLITLSLLTLSQEFIKAGAPDASYFQTGGIVLIAASNYAWMLGQSVFCIGVLMLNYLLYQSRRIPRWLSGWGFIGAPLMLVAGFLLLVDGDPNSPLSNVLYAPLALQEMVFAVWLIV
ncbi:MAG: DUF4386 domain-containing protein [ANME-2 cluster archaeon]|nr:MAG: DUF4386 domain-containing protein [ANME-2 cluster archaeon]